MKQARKKRFDWRTPLYILLMITVLGTIAAVISTDRSDGVGYEPMPPWYDDTPEAPIESYPNAFPDLRGVVSATVNGTTVESAAVNMGAGRISIAEVDADSTFDCTLATEVPLSAGCTYYGFYRTEVTGFAPLALADELGPFALELVDEGTEATLSGDLSTGMTVSEDTTVTVKLLNCMDGETPHIESGVYQIYIIAVE